MDAVPIFIPIRDRLSSLVTQLEWLGRAEAVGEIILVDNQSSYPPMLDFLDKTEHRVIRLNHNQGGNAPWACGLVGDHAWYVVTDPDIVPREDCPLDAIPHFKDGIERWGAYNAAGFGLDIRDLPDHYCGKKDVIRVESPYWRDSLDAEWFAGAIDTTFALHRKPGGGGCVALRSKDPYIARHVPWYLDTSNYSEEDQYYLDHLPSDLGWWHRYSQGFRHPEGIELSNPTQPYATTRVLAPFD